MTRRHNSDGEREKSGYSKTSVEMANVGKEGREEVFEYYLTYLYLVQSTNALRQAFLEYVCLPLLVERKRSSLMG